MTLGCEDYTAALYRKGGDVLIGTFPRLTALGFGRHLDETVPGTLVVPTGDCCDLLSSVDPWATEIVLFRGGERVAEGPVIVPDIRPTSAAITFSDVSAWLGERVVKQRFRLHDHAVTVAGAAIREALLADDPNILRYLQLVCASVSPKVTGKAARYSQTWDTMLSSLSDVIDWTVLLRRIIVMPQGAPLGYGPSLTDADFAGNLGVQIDGGALATHLFGIDGARLLAERSESSAFYGVHERLVDFSQNGIDEIAAGALLTPMMQAAYLAPASIVMPSDASFTPQSHVNFNDLVPGVVFDVSTRAGCTPLEQKMRLLTMDVTVDRDGERITASFGNPTDVPDCRPIRVAPPPPSDYIFDDFNRADDNLSMGITPVGARVWVPGDPNVFGIRGDQAFLYARSGSNRWAAVECDTGDGTVEVELLTLDDGINHRAGIMARKTIAEVAAGDSQNQIEFDTGSAGTVLGFNYLGSFGTLYSDLVAPTTPCRLRLVMNGPTITAYVNGVQIYTGSPPNLMANTRSAHGILIFDDSTQSDNARVNEFSFTPL